MIDDSKALKKNEKDAIAFRHSVPVQMRFNDVDALGHINNSIYFSYYDLGKSAYFTTIKKGEMDWGKVDVVVANVNCNFFSPVYFGEPISVVTRVEAIYSKSFKMHQRIVNTVSGEIKSECSSIMVSIDTKTNTSTELSHYWIKAISEYEGKNLLDSHSQQK